MKKTKVFIKPETILKLKKLWPNARKQGFEIGQTWEVGYYCRCCGLDTIWLCEEKQGKYSGTIDQEFLIEHFVIIKNSNIRNIYSPPKNSKRKKNQGKEV